MATERETHGATAVLDLLLVLVALVGLGTSVLLVVQYAAPGAAMCRPGGGCEAVRYSEWAAIAGIPTPIFGVVFFAAVIGLGLAGLSKGRKLTLALTGAGALAAGGFIALQGMVIKAVCAYCVVADSAAILTFGLAIALGRAGQPARSRARLLAIGGATAAVIIAAILVPHLRADDYQSNQVPKLIEAYQRPGVVTIVEFIDFECPACREQHGHFKEALANYGDNVRLIYKHHPLSFHPHAMTAARAAICVGDELLPTMANRLFTAASLEAKDIETMVVELGVVKPAFLTCVDSDQTKELIKQDNLDGRALGLRGLPTFWIGREKFEGVQRTSTLRGAIDRALDAAK